MSDPASQDSDGRWLRERATARLEMTRSDVRAMAPEEVERLVQELQVHQIELELQNEEMREAQVELSDSRDRLSDLYEFAPVGYLTLGAQGKITRCNLAAAEMFGTDRQALMKKHLSEFAPRESQDDLYFHLQGVFASEEKQIAEIALRCAKGGGRILRFESRCVPDRDSPGELICHTALIDLTELKHAEEELCDARDQLEVRVEQRTRELRLMSQVFRDGTDPIIIHDTKGTILNANAEVERLFGWSRHELVGRSLKLIVPEDRHAEVDEMMARAGRGEAVRNIEGERLTKDGERIPVLLTKSLLVSESGDELPVLASIAKDLRELKRTETELRESRALAEMHRDIAYMANRARDIEEAVRFCLERVSFYNGWSFGHAYFPAPDNPVYLEPTASCYMLDEKRFEGFRQATLQLRQERGVGLPGRVFATGAPQWSSDLEELADRAEFAKELGIATVAVFPILVREEVVGVLEFFSEKIIDVDPRLEESMAAIGAQLGRVFERQESERRLRASEARLRQLTEHLRDVVWMRDAETLRLLYCNKAFETVFGRSRSMLEEDSGFFLEAVHRQDRKRMRMAVEKLKTGGEMDETLRIVRPDEAIRWLRCRGYPVRDAAGRIYRFAGTAEDITDRKKADNEMRRLEREISEASEEERRRIAQDMHDGVGSLLTGINFRIKSLGSEMAEISEDAKGSLESISSMVSEAIKQTRMLTRGLYPVGDDPGDLVLALRDLAAAVESNGTLACRFVCDDPVLIEDSHAANQLYRIAQEAANNAVKHSGGNTLCIELSKRDDCALLVVEDDGDGFDLDAMLGGPGGFGLRIMQYRANEVGADLRIVPGGTSGMRVVCTYPFAGED